MPLFPTKVWVRNLLREIRDQLTTLPMPWNTREINPLVYLKEDKDADRLCIHRSRDNQLIAYMDCHRDGDIYLVHMGLWEPDFAAAIGEGLILLNRIHKDRVQAAMDAKNAEMAEFLDLPTQKGTR